MYSKLYIYTDICTLNCIYTGIFKDGRIVEDRALGIYPNSVWRFVHFYMASLAAALVLNSNNQL